MDFCPNCQSGLFPTEIEEELYLVCRICEHKEKNTKTVVKRKVYRANDVQDYGSNRYLRYDPTYPHTRRVKCPNDECPSVTDKDVPSDAIYFNDARNLKVIYICTVCNTEWKQS